MSLLERARDSPKGIRPVMHDSNRRKRNQQSSFSVERPGKHQVHSAPSSAIVVDEEEACYSLYPSCGDIETSHYKQHISPFSSLFGAVQTIIMMIMLIQCGIAPFKVNPMLGPYPDALNYWGAKNATLIIDDGELWRLFTPVFLHAGVLHLMGNVMVQFQSGNLWEREWGSLVWMLVYVGSTLGSSILSTCLMPDQISVGSSGALMGLFGAKMAEIFLLCCETSYSLSEHMGARSRQEQACGVIMGVILVMAMSFVPYVDWSAHLGGLVAGFAIGMVCFSFQIRNWLWILLWLVAGVGTTFALFSIALAYMFSEVQPVEELRDVCGYYQRNYEGYECRCMLAEAIEWGSWSDEGWVNTDQVYSYMNNNNNA